MKKVIKKGEIYEKKIFALKDPKLKGEPFLEDVKVSFTDLINKNYGYWRKKQGKKRNVNQNKIKEVKIEKIKVKGRGER